MRSSFPAISVASALLLGSLGLSAIGCSSEEAQCGAAATYGLSTDAATAEAGAVVTLKLSRTGPACAYEGGGAEDVTLEVVAGGGSLGTTTVPVPAAGSSVPWTLGHAPIRNAVRIAGDDDSEISVVAAVSTPIVPEIFGGLHEWLDGQGDKSTTEDLAFLADGSVAMGIDAGVVVGKLGDDGKVTWSKMALTGDPLPRSHGMAFDRQGTLWTADTKGQALHAISASGVVKTHLTTNGNEPLKGPNDVAVAPGDWVIVSDPCRGELIAYDPKTEAVTDVHTFSLKTEGGPNGFAFWGDELYVVTENVTLLCPTAAEKPPATDPLAALFKLSAKDGKFGAHTVIESGLGVFGDGMVFDAEGNLYVVVDTADGFALAESRVMVLRKGESKLVEFAAFKKDTVIANVAFGVGAFGETTLYGALLAIPPFTGEDKRGLIRIPLGVKTHPLLP
ncbi:MAG: hypothetical protein H6747_07905 [Deltaproteobacteria bacterium]|nr:hypothetical protein [Deltaproteobacteria bacterium]